MTNKLNKTYRPEPEADNCLYPIAAVSSLYSSDEGGISDDNNRLSQHENRIAPHQIDKFIWVTER